MTGKTHKIGGVVSALAGYTLLKSNGLLLPDVPDLLQFAVMYPFALFGAAFPDYDHHLGSSSAGEPVGRMMVRIIRIPNTILNKMESAFGNSVKKTSFYKFLNMFKVSHRSWQTHAIEWIPVIGLVILWLMGLVPTAANSIMVLLVVGFGLGFISHVFLDAMTMAGTPTFIGTVISKFVRGFPKNVRFVPGIKLFGTDTKYEILIRRLLNVIAYSLLFYIFARETGLLDFIMGILM